VSDTRVVFVTAPDADTAARLAHTLVEERLAACGNLLPGVRSIYRWEGKVCDEAEVMLILKTTAAGADALRERVIALHPYACPEVLVLAVESAHEPYARWVREQVGGG
jgi:periplasmic divalent cation tolerance protein